MIMLLLFGKRAHENEKEPKKLIKYLFPSYKEQNSPRTLYFLSTQIYKYLDLLLCAQNAHGSEWVNHNHSICDDNHGSYDGIHHLEYDSHIINVMMMRHNHLDEPR